MLFSLLHLILRRVLGTGRESRPLTRAFRPVPSLGHCTSVLTTFSSQFSAVWTIQ
jgi:hypothetical protein